MPTCDFDLDARRRIAASLVRAIDAEPSSSLLDCLSLAIMEERLIYGTPAAPIPSDPISQDTISRLVETWLLFNAQHGRHTKPH